MPFTADNHNFLRHLVVRRGYYFDEGISETSVTCLSDIRTSNSNGQ